jgi:hypothetical protein
MPLSPIFNSTPVWPAIQPVIGAVDAVNFPRYLAAKADRYEGSYADFLRGVRFRSSSPDVTIGDASPSSSSVAGVGVAVNLYVVAKYWRERVQTLLDETAHVRVPTQLRRVQDVQVAPSSLAAVFADTKGIEREQRWIIDPLPSIEGVADYTALILQFQALERDIYAKLPWALTRKSPR